MNILFPKKILILIPLVQFVSFVFPQNPKASVTLTNTNLPIVFIKTNGQQIPDSPNVVADLRIIDHGYTIINNVTDPINSYNGKIGIQTRGSWTAQYPQKSYAVTTIDAQGIDFDTSLLGMKTEHKWVMYAPYDDRTFMLNPLAFKLARDMGQWAPHTRFCEVMLDTGSGYDYTGVYVMMEKIKRDKNRVDISKLDINDNAGDSLSGGYIIGIDSNINGPDSGFTTKNSPQLFVRYIYPGGDLITSAQKNYIQKYIDTVENALLANNFADPINGYRKYMDENSFIDFFIIQELSKNLDGFKRSAFMYKDKFSKGGKLMAGPQWDFNSAWGNSVNNQGIMGVCGYDKPDGWVYQNTTCWIHTFGGNFPVPFYWNRLHEDPEFVHHLKCRWMKLRQTFLSKSYINNLIDSMQNYVSNAAVRQYQKYDFSYNYADGVDSLKSWISKRIDWMDANMPGSCLDIGITENNETPNSFFVYPNPVTDVININMNLIEGSNLSVTFADAIGRYLIVLKEEYYSIGNHRLSISTSNFASGIYYLKFQSLNSTTVKKVVITQN